MGAAGATHWLGGLEIDIGLAVAVVARDPADLVDELAHGQEPLGRALVECAHDHGLDRARHRRQRRRHPDRAAGVRLDRVAGEHEVVQRAERVQIGALIDRLAVVLLGCDEAGDAGDLVAGRHREREVDQLHVGAGEQDVLGGEIAMHDADLCGLDQRLADDLDQVRRLVERDRTAHRDRLGEGLRAVEQLERDPAVVAALARRQHLRDAGALHPLELLELALEALRESGQRDDRGRDELHRGGLASCPVGRAVHRAGPVTTQRLADLELGGQRVGDRGLALEGSEASSVDRTEVRVVAELLLALGANLHAGLLITRIVRTSIKESNLARRPSTVEHPGPPHGCTRCARPAD